MKLLDFVAGFAILFFSLIGFLTFKEKKRKEEIEKEIEKTRLDDLIAKANRRKGRRDN